MVRIRGSGQLGYTGVLFDDKGVAYVLTPPGTPEDHPIRPEEFETRGSSTKPSSTKNLRSSSSAIQTNVEGSTSGKRKLDQPSPDDEMNPRKKNKIDHSKEPEKLRGVYFKNQKWQAVIKVDKKKIHLGTFDTQADAARLYDRAAFLCGRKPSFELPKEEIEELIKLNWEQFMEKIILDTFTRRSRRRQMAAGLPSKSNSPVIEPRAKRALSFSEAPKPEGSASSSGWLWPIIHGPASTSDAVARLPNESDPPVMEPRAERAPEPEGSPSSSGWLWPIVHGPASTPEAAARPPNGSNSPVIEPRAERTPEPEGSPSSSGWLWPIVHGPASTSEAVARPPNQSNSPVIEPRAERAPEPKGSPSSSGWLWPIAHGPTSTSES